MADGSHRAAVLISNAMVVLMVLGLLGCSSGPTTTSSAIYQVDRQLRC